LHAIHPHSPRVLIVALVAALLTTAILWALAPRLGDLGIGSSANPAHATVPARSAVLAAPVPRQSQPSWLTNPLASPFNVVLPWAHTKG